MGDKFTFITPKDLMATIGSSSGPTILDVRRAAVVADATDMIESAIWRDPALVDDWGGDLSFDRDYVVYCVHGHEVSQNAAAALRSKGIRARYLQGGIDSYRDAGGRMMRRNSNAK